jgi:uncharacterized membrane protein
MHLLQRLERRGADRGCGTGDRGAVLPIVALSLAFLITSVAVGVDHGRVTSTRRDLQKVADLAALDTARTIDGRSTGELQPDAEAAALASAVRNKFLPPSATSLNFGDQSLDVVLGNWNTATRMFTPTTVDEVPNAVRIVAADVIDYYFHPGDNHTDRQATAMEVVPGSCVGDGCAQPGTGTLSTFSLGSFLFSMDKAAPSDPALTAFASLKTQYLNATLGMFLGANTPDGHLGLDLVGYRGLGAADITLDALAAALGFGTTRELLTTSVKVTDLLDAAASVLDQQGASSASAQAAMVTIANQASTTASVLLGNLLDVAAGSEGTAGRASLNALDFVAGVSMITGRSLATTSVQLPITNPLTGTPYLTGTLEAALIEPPVFVISKPPGYDASTGRYFAYARTAQLNTALDITVPGVVLSGVTVTVNVPVYTTGASADAGLVRTECAVPLEDTVETFDVATAGITTRIGQTSDLTADPVTVSPGNLFSVDLPLVGHVNAAATSNADVGGTSDPAFAIVGPYQDPNIYRIGGGTASDVGTALFNNLAVTGLGSTLTSSLKSQLQFVFDGLDGQVIRPLTSALGVSIAGADLNAIGVECGIPVLVD